MLTVAVSDLDTIQDRAADGGPVTSEWLDREDVRPGHLVAVHSRWAAVEHVRPQRTAYVVQCLEIGGGRALRYLAEGCGIEARTDTRVDLSHDALLALEAQASPVRQRTVMCEDIVTAADLRTGRVVHRYVDDRAPHGRLWLDVPCCDRRVRIAEVLGLTQILTCCRCRLLYACTLAPDGDGGCFAVLTVLVDMLLVAAHRGGRQPLSPPDQPLVEVLAERGPSWT